MMEYKYLNTIYYPTDLKTLPLEALPTVCDEVRDFIIQQLSQNPGHLGSSLGTVELTVALHYVFDTPHDQLIWDVGHQCYPHKMLTGRANAFLDEKHYSDVSNYTAPHESPYDLFELGHTSTSISIALGMAKARDLLKGNEFIIAFIGEGSLGGGVALEGLQLASNMSKFIIIVNDNDQSIADNQGTLYNHLEALRKTRGKDEANIFEEFDYEYIYVDNGNDLGNMLYALESAKEYAITNKKPIVIHIITKKGYGFEYSEEDPEKWHWHPSYNPESGKAILQEKWHCKNEFADYINAKIKDDPKVVILTAGTPGYIGFDEKHREEAGKNFIDVGICEQTAMAMSAGLSKRGCCPIWAVQYTFLQRAYDQLYEEVTINNLHVVVTAFDSGIYGISAKTHIGLCTIPMLTHIPNLTVLAPTSNEFTAILDWTISAGSGPFVILVPTLKSCYNVQCTHTEFRKYQVINDFAIDYSFWLQ